MGRLKMREIEVHNVGRGEQVSRGWGGGGRVRAMGRGLVGERKRGKRKSEERMKELENVLALHHTDRQLVISVSRS